MKQSKALHETGMPKGKANPLGTGPDSAWQDPLDTAYGVEYEFTIDHDEIQGKAGGVNPYSIVQITGLKNEEVSEKINKCLENTARTLAAPGYLPDVAGILNIVKEKGVPETEVRSECDYVHQGILSVRIFGSWKWWSEDRDFPDWETFYYDWLQREKVLLGTGTGIELEYEVLEENDDGDILRLYYAAHEVHYLNFDLRTGEVLSLSDMFPKGFDYLEYVNREAKNTKSFWEVEGRAFWFSDDEYRETGEVRGSYGRGYDESLYEYDGGPRPVPVQLTGDEEFVLTGEASLTIKDDHGKNIWIACPEIIADRTQGESLYDKPDSARVFRQIGWVECCPGDIDGPRTDNASAIGSFRVSPGGSEEITVTVYTDKPYDAETNGGRSREEILETYATDEKLIAYAKQCVALQPEICTPGEDLRLYIKTIHVFPRGYFSIYWFPVSESEALANRDSDYLEAEIQETWFADGRAIPMEELFDVSCEELVQELNRSFGDWVPPFHSDDAAEVIATYLDGLWSVSISYGSDPYVLFRHLRMYEGYPFE